MDKLLEIIREISFPSAYDHFAEGEVPEPPYLLYMCPASDNFAADNKSYFRTNEIHLELYTDCKDLSAERKVESILDEHDIFFERTEIWIKSEKLYEVLYSFNMEA